MNKLRKSEPFWMNQFTRMIQTCLVVKNCLDKHIRLFPHSSLGSKAVCANEVTIKDVTFG